MDKESNNNDINIKKKYFVLTIIIVSLISIILLTSIVSFFKSNSISPVNGQGELLSISSQNVYALEPGQIACILNPVCREIGIKLVDLDEQIADINADIDRIENVDLPTKENEKAGIDANIENLRNQRGLVVLQLNTELSQLAVACGAFSTQDVCRETRNTIAKLRADIKDIDDLLKPVTKKQRDLQQQINALNKDIRQLNQKLDTINNQINKLEAEWETNKCEENQAGIPAGIPSSPLFSNDRIQSSNNEKASTRLTITSQMACGDQCVDTNTNSEHCGGCGINCAQTVGVGSTCNNGICLCPQGQNACGDQCTDINNDNQNCGGCGIICEQTVGAGATCNNGICLCPQGQEVFNDQCVDKCPDGQTRDTTTGQCLCPEGQIVDPISGQCTQCPIDKPDVCSNKCTNLDSDNENCNFCGNECEPPLICKPDPVRPTESRCQAPPPCYYDGHPRKTACGGSDCCISDPFFGIVCALDTGTPDQRFCFCGPNGMGACSTTPPQ